MPKLAPVQQMPKLSYLGQTACFALCALRFPLKRLRGPCSPMAEAVGLNPIRCAFESRQGYQEAESAKRKAEAQRAKRR